jgi:hypothetical protein
VSAPNSQQSRKKNRAEKKNAEKKTIRRDARQKKEIQGRNPCHGRSSTGACADAGTAATSTVLHGHNTVAARRWENIGVSHGSRRVQRNEMVSSVHCLNRSALATTRSTAEQWPGNKQRGRAHRIACLLAREQREGGSEYGGMCVGVWWRQNVSEGCCEDGIEWYSYPCWMH